MMRRVLSVAMALMLVCTLPLTTLAAEWDLVNGDIKVEVKENNEGGSTQTVQQGSAEAVTDNNPIIKSSGETSNTITVSTEGNTTANITIDNVNIDPGYESAIDVVGDSNLNLNVEGTNTISSEWGYAGIHVSSGNLTITGSGTLNVTGDDGGAAIGSDNQENMSGDITIKGDVHVTAKSDSATAIGSGWSGDMSGNITIEGNAEVNAETENSSAAIGSGTNAHITETGSITISGNADVTATSKTSHDINYGGAAIGCGDNGNMNGSITIEENASVAANAGGTGAAIGSGNDGDIGETGSITIQGNTSVTTTNGEFMGRTGASIGTGYCGNMNGTIRIGNKATLNLNGGEIGAGTYGEVHGSIEYFIEPEDAVAVDAGEDASEWNALYRVVDEKENDISFTATRKDGVLTIHCDYDCATFLAKTVNLNTLKAQGIHTIVFETENATSTFEIEDISDEGPLRLTHNGKTVTFTLEDTDISEILK